MAASKKDLQVQKKGMNRQVHDSELDKTEYSFALNANLQDEHGNGDVILQNEPSNILCSTLRYGYKVIGFKFDVNFNRTYLWLVDPINNRSEIGYVNVPIYADSLEELLNNCDCDPSVILETPLQNTVPTPTCEYIMLVEDDANECEGGRFDFNINYPIHPRNIEIKHERLGVYIYWTDGLNPPRVILLNTLGTIIDPKYTTTIDCETGDFTPKCLDVDSMRIFRLFDKPCLTVVDTTEGGSLKAGAYEVMIAYSNMSGEAVSNYYSLTNPVTIFDKNNYQLDQTLLDYTTGKAISLEVSGLDTDYEFFHIAVIYISGLDQFTSIYDYGVYPTDTSKITINTLNNKPILGGKEFTFKQSLQLLLNVRPNILKTKGLTAANGYLFQYGYDEQRELNLQPVVNLMGAFAKWATVQSKEDLYEYGDNVSNYKGYMRDEVYPFGIKFFLKGGYETALFPFIPAPAIGDEKTDLSNLNTESVLQHNPECSVTQRAKKWQFLNTADSGTFCTVDAGITTQVVERLVDGSCVVDNDNNNVPDTLKTIASGNLTYTSELDFLDYINANKNYFATLPTGTATELALKDTFTKRLTLTGTTGSAIIEVDGTSYSVTFNTSLTVTASDFVTAQAATFSSVHGITLTSSSGVLKLATSTVLPSIKVFNLTGTLGANEYLCTPDFPSSTEPLIQTSDEYFAISVDTNAVTSSPAAVGSYPRVTPPVSCTNLITDATTGDYLIDPEYAKYPYPTYKRINVSNNSPESARELSSLSDPQIDSPKHLLNKVATSPVDLQTAYTVTAYSPNFTNKIHTNAAWFKVTMEPGEVRIIEISPILCNQSDGNTGDELRLSFISDPLGTATEVDTRHITNLTSFDSTNNFITLNANDFTGNVAYIAIDSPLVLNGIARVRVDINSATSGDTGTITITKGTDVVDYDYEVDSAGKARTQKNVLETHKTNMFNWSSSIITEGPTTEDFYIYYDSSTTTVSVSGDAAYINPALTVSYYSLQPPCGCFNIFKRKQLNTISVDFTNLNFGKVQEYERLCTFNVPVLANCRAVPHKKGKFGYWESTETYPCNFELFDSSNLTIPQALIPINFRSDFEDYYTTSLGIDGNYVLNDVETNFTNQPIRHYKFPSNTQVPFMNTEDLSGGDFKNSIIYPIGFDISPDIVNAFLDVAVTNSLISAEERAKITKYEIYRGDRRTERSVVAKGLLFDMLNEEEGERKIYPNYPLNSLGNDDYNGTNQASRNNLNYSFLSPETLFAKPTLPNELSIEGYLFGKSKSIFDTVENHPTYVILGSKGYTLATTLAVAEVGLETIAKLSDWTVLGGTGGISSAISIGAAIAGGISYTLASVFRVGQVRLQWIKTLYDLGQPKNHAYYQAAVGHYNYFVPNSVTNSLLRGLSISHYLKEGMWNIADESTGTYVKVNNLDREESVYVSLGQDDSYKITYPTKYSNYDNTSTNPTKASRRGYSGVGRSTDLMGNAASPYAAIKRYLPAQYGGIGAVNWISTGFCGDLSAESYADCNPIFGGDTFISRLAVKRKFPFFTTDAYGLPPLTPFTYSLYFNINPDDRKDLDGIGPKRFYLNYKTVDEQGYEVGIGSAFFPTIKSQFKLDYLASSSRLYVNEEAKFYLYSYGFAHFLVESEINCNYRYTGYEDREQFYPRMGDIIKYTQEKNVSIKTKEGFLYNRAYSSTPIKTNWRTLPFNYNRRVQDLLAQGKNSLIVSKQDRNEVSLTDPWMYYNALDMHEFPRNFGELVSIVGIENAGLLVRFTNGLTLFQAGPNAIAQLGASEVSFNVTDLGYAGTQHNAIVSCEFGHFTCDAKRGKVFKIASGGNGLEDITRGLEKWFKEQLPFKILRQFPQAKVDNAFKGLGLVMGWDDRMKRLFITKKDFTVVSNPPTEVFWNDEIGFNTTINDVVTPLDYTNTAYFKDCSWTVAYSPLTESWVSYYSFKPNYFISYPTFFQTGMNYSSDATEIGLWSHMSFLSSYQVFYGKLYPFTIEYALPTKYSNSTLQALQYWADVRKYYNKYDYTDVYGKGFNKAIVYNNQQNSGLLNLVHQKENDFNQMATYPKHNATSIDILQSEINGEWSFNYFYNLIKNERSGLPIFRYDDSNVEKTLNNNLLDYRPTQKDRLRGDYFKVYLSQDIESRFKYLLRLTTDDRNYY